MSSKPLKHLSEVTLEKKNTHPYFISLKYSNYGIHKLGVSSHVLRKVLQHTEKILPMWKILTPVLWYSSWSPRNSTSQRLRGLKAGWYLSQWSSVASKDLNLPAEMKPLANAQRDHLPSEGLHQLEKSNLPSFLGQHKSASAPTEGIQSPWMLQAGADHSYPLFPTLQPSTFPSCWGEKGKSN